MFFFELLRILFKTKGLCKIFPMAQVPDFENNLKSSKYLTLGRVHILMTKVQRAYGSFKNSYVKGYGAGLFGNILHNAGGAYRLLAMKKKFKMSELLIPGHRNILITRVMRIFYTWVMVSGMSLFVIP
jgi:hypothetical protein